MLIFKRFFHILLVMLALAGLTSCGFQLRDSYAVPESMRIICLSSQASDALEIELEKRLLRSQVILSNDTQSCAQLTLIEDKIERSVLSLFPNAQVAEYELNYLVTYSVTFPNQAARTFNVEVARDYQDDPEAVLAKSKEMNLLMQELRRFAAQQIFLQLASLEKR